VATPQTRPFPLKEQDARNLFFFHNQRLFFRAAAMSGVTVAIHSILKEKNYKAKFLTSSIFKK